MSLGPLGKLDMALASRGPLPLSPGYTKQVIVIRTDLRNLEGQKVRSGKIASQVAHASMAFLIRRLESKTKLGFIVNAIKLGFYLMKSECTRNWMMSNYTKITLAIDSQVEFEKLYAKAKQAGLEVNMITDLGRTEFGGIPTNTCLCIGPCYASDIEPITKGLKLY